MNLSQMFLLCGIKEASSIPFDACSVINPRKTERFGFKPHSVCLGIIPYYTPLCDSPRILSSYAVSRDYHIYAKEVTEKIRTLFNTEYPDNHITFFCDSSPIAEVEAAAKAGLGIIGDNGLLITEKYSSYIFIFEAFSDIPPEKEAAQIQRCKGCKNCRKACPMLNGESGDCLSAITQKKGELTTDEQNLMLKYNTVWGCDICQDVCPHSRKVKKSGTVYTDIDWFYKECAANPTSEEINDAEFLESRAYAWRGKNTIARNIRLFEEKNK